MNRTETSQLNSALNVTELSDQDFQMLVDIYELADRSAYDQQNPLQNCEHIAKMVKSFFEKRGLYSVYEHELDEYHYSIEDGGN